MEKITYEHHESQNSIIRGNLRKRGWREQSKFSAENYACSANNGVL
ncbi:MAG: hypothetical protein KGJ58_04620 [Patescibacteria group bacterium]|nr:hypothetical protein [Patescibacteria group bacterium]MDE1988806.1 hypothetical protein [Patescibacteria group bacterium]MDE2218693.1 hypothetical protein [Patescibacteria group bacterium]